jgi:hypothetical protein
MTPERTTDHFNSRTTAFTRTILSRSIASEIRSDLGLGTASLLDSSGGVQTSGNQTITGNKVFNGTVDVNSILKVGTTNSSLSDCVLQLGYTPIDFYGFRWINTNSALNSAAGSLRLQRGTVTSWVDTVTVDNNGSWFFNNTVSANISGNASTVSNGVYIVGDQTINGSKTFSSPIIGNLTGNATTATNASTVTNGVYTTGSQSIGGTKTFTSTVFAPAYRVSSDPQLKDNMQDHEVVSNVDLIKLKSWTWKHLDVVPEQLRGKQDSGVDASVVAKVFPSCVEKDANGFLTVDYGKLAVHLILAKGE